jgi:hypothetical protein
MKKNLILALIAVFVMIPLASFAKTTMSDSELGTVTGQEGVSINFDNFTGINISSTSWGVPTTGSRMNHRHPKKIACMHHHHPHKIPCINPKPIPPTPPPTPI